jgi:hypothetical protein
MKIRFMSSKSKAWKKSNCDKLKFNIQVAEKCWKKNQGKTVVDRRWQQQLRPCLKNYRELKIKIRERGEPWKTDLLISLGRDGRKKSHLCIIMSWCEKKSSGESNLYCNSVLVWKESSDEGHLYCNSVLMWKKQRREPSIIMSWCEKKAVARAIYNSVLVWKESSGESHL